MRGSSTPSLAERESRWMLVALALRQVVNHLPSERRGRASSGNSLDTRGSRPLGLAGVLVPPLGKRPWCPVDRATRGRLHRGSHRTGYAAPEDASEVARAPSIPTATCKRAGYLTSPVRGPLRTQFET